jgi:hypothetical protein
MKRMRDMREGKDERVVSRERRGHRRILSGGEDVEEVEDEDADGIRREHPCLRSDDRRLTAVIFAAFVETPGLDQDDAPLVEVLSSDDAVRLFQEGCTCKRTLLVGSDVQTSLVDDALDDFDPRVDELNPLNFHLL